MHNNIFKILGVVSREDCVTNALAYAIEHSLKFRRFFLDKICDVRGDACETIQVKTRMSIGESGVPDLVLICSGQSRINLIVIENKLRAGEGDDQTQRYADQKCIENIKILFGIDHSDVQTTFIFLTLFPDQNPESSTFKKKSHSDLIGYVSDPPEMKNMAEQLIADWIDLVKKFNEYATINDNDDFREKLGNSDDLDGNYLYFRNVFKNIQAACSFEPRECFRAKERGRKYYLIQFSKKNWTPAEELNPEEFRNKFEADRQYDVHFEIQYDTLNNGFKICLHYETNPYMSEKEFKANVDPNQYGRHLFRKSRLQEILVEKNLLNTNEWSVGGGYLQVAKYNQEYNPAGQTLKEASGAIETLLNCAAQAVDQALVLLTAEEA